jgi:hypothetical protein
LARGENTFVHRNHQTGQDARVLSARVAAAISLSVLLTGGCLPPYKGPKTLAALGVGLLATGATMWVVGERGDHQGLTRAGVVTTVAGAAAAFAAGGWLAASVGCRTDPDCAETEACKEIPAPPGREPYKQCVPR